jgi:hypothetical protein
VAEQESVVQGLLSSQDAGSTGVCTHPAWLVHVSVVHWLLSLQSVGVSTTQLPLEHTALVHPSPSSQPTPSSSRP